MKLAGKIVAMLVLVFSMVAGATSFDGNYKFSSRVKNGAPDLQGWTGDMVVKGDTISRTYKSVDGKEERFYIGTIKKDGDVYVVKYTKAYKPEYVGNEHKNKFIVNGATLSIEATDGKFKEVWTKK
ncbi:MAG: hypothetical protein HY877_02735 [Deltaproteobacteria bacterium]|nr:hypothetical protein [Deltaproteobacteria bacterium]